jgi:chorismate mutase/prephenate dehydratase
MSEQNIKLQEARAIISDIDREIAVLFEKRIRAVETVAEYKKLNGLPVEDLIREAQLLEENSKLISDEKIKEYYIEFQKNVMVLSKEYQRKLNGDV